MATAKILKGTALQECCLNCGSLAGEIIAVVRDEDGKPGWFGCTKCWPRVLAKGQLGTVRQMVKALDLPKDSKTRNK